MRSMLVMCLTVVLTVTTFVGCGGKRPENNPQFNPETAAHPEKIANPMQGISPGARPGAPGGPPGPVRTGP